MVFGIMKKKEHHDELQDIRMHVLGKQEQPKEQKPVNASTNSMNSLEVKLIKITNDVEAIKTKIDQTKAELTQEINKVYADVESLSDLVKYVPKETLAELRNIKQTQPGAYDELKQIVSEKVKASVVDVIDANIIRLVKDSNEIDSHKLLEKVENGRVCSKNTLYIHLTKLTEKGLLLKKRVGHEVVYLAKQEAQPVQQTQPAPQPAAPVTEAKVIEVKAA